MKTHRPVSRFAVASAVWGAVAVGCSSLFLGGVASGSAPPKQAGPATGGGSRVQIRRKVIRDAFQAQTALQKAIQQRLRVQPGAEQEAKDYYQRISRVLQFNFEGSNLDALLTYMGYAVSNGANPPVYTGLIARDLEGIPSFALMPRDDGEFAALKTRVANATAFDSQFDLADFQNDRVLVSRFFAPKIATYYDPDDKFNAIERDDIVPGWRKLVRLSARPGSAASRADVAHMYLLFNVKEQDPEEDPFTNESQNNQVILVPGNQDRNDSAYFAVYGKRGDGYPLSLFLAADFDLPGHVGVTVPEAQDGKYFVPRSCGECHGHSGGEHQLRGEPVNGEGRPADFKSGIYRFAKPNYLDTDQWYDWSEFDYRGMTSSLNDVVFDGGKSHGSAEYARAMEVVTKLNQTIRDQTFAAEQARGKRSYQTLAAEKWLSLHKADPQRAPYSRRSIGAQTWNGADRNEMRLLRLLDNHCFRCHSSLRYNVFDREAVGEKKDEIKFYLALKVRPDLPGFFMPQGRVLENAERDEIIRLLDVVFSSP